MAHTVLTRDSSTESIPRPCYLLLARARLAHCAMPMGERRVSWRSAASRTAHELRRVARIVCEPHARGLALTHDGGGGSPRRQPCRRTRWGASHMARLSLTRPPSCSLRLSKLPHIVASCGVPEAWRAAPARRAVRLH